MKKRILYYDILNIACCLCMIALHHNGVVFSFSDTSAWRQSLVVECVCYWAVPVFMMLSGANLLNYRKKYTTTMFMKKRIQRTVIPWMAWSIILLFWKIQTSQLTLESYSLVNILNIVVNNKVESVYWFFTPLFACYLTIPILSILIDRRKVLWYIVIINFFFCSILPVLPLVTGVYWNISVPFTENMIIFVVLGYLLSTQNLVKQWRISLYVLGAVSVIFRYVYTLIHSLANNTLDTSIKGYQVFHSVFLAVAIFELAKNIDWEKIIPSSWKEKISKLASYTFGIYLIHQVIMYYELKILHLSSSSFLWRIPCILVTYVISATVVCIICKIPLLKKIMG